MPDTRPSPEKRWCFTINNPTDEEAFYVAAHGESIGTFGDQSPFSYLIFGKETGDSGTPHLQGFFILNSRKRLHQIKEFTGFERSHLEAARGTSYQASEYCKKEGDYLEYGTPPTKPGSAGMFEELRDWIKAQPIAPTERDIWETFPALAGRYPGAVTRAIAIFGRRPLLVEGTLREWQQQLDSQLDEPPHGRRITFVVDPEGNTGKSWLTRYWMTTRSGSQMFGVAKRDDIAHAIDINVELAIFDIPRGQSEFIQYGVFEMLKNRMVFSPKYSSNTKILRNTPHVIVFMNEEPDREALTRDRYHIFRPNAFVNLI